MFILFYPRLTSSILANILRHTLHTFKFTFAILWYSFAYCSILLHTIVLLLYIRSILPSMDLCTVPCLNAPDILFLLRFILPYYYTSYSSPTNILQVTCFDYFGYFSRLFFCLRLSFVALGVDPSQPVVDHNPRVQNGATQTQSTYARAWITRFWI